MLSVYISFADNLYYVAFHDVTNTALANVINISCGCTLLAARLDVTQHAAGLEYLGDIHGQLCSMPARLLVRSVTTGEPRERDDRSVFPCIF